MPAFLIFENILVPALISILLLVYFLYVIFFEDSKPDSTWYFAFFILFLCLYLFGQPVQILSGTHPLPLIIDNIRSFIFFAFLIPLLALSDFSRPDISATSRILKQCIIGITLGTSFCMLNTLFTTGSELIFSIGSFSVYDSTSAKFTIPFFTKEIPSILYLIPAILIFSKTIDTISKTKAPHRSIVLYNAGKLIFSLTVFSFVVFQNQMLYYSGILVSTVLMGTGRTLDLREKRRKTDTIISYIREDLVQNIAINECNHRQICEMLKQLQYPADMNTFIVFKETGNHNSSLENCIDNEKKQLTAEISVILNRIRGKNQFILIPLGTDMTGICLSISQNPDFGRSETIRICEHLRKSLDILRNYDFGIGRSYSGLENLRESYTEAVNASEYAESMGSGQVVHITDLQEEVIRIEYPLKERNSFLSAVRMGDSVKARELLQTLLGLLFRYSAKAEKLLKIRIYELLGAMIESAITGGGDVNRLLEVSEKVFSEAAHMRNQIHIEEWLKSRTEEIIGIVSCSHTNRSLNIVRKAKEYIDEHFAQAISVKDVADAVCISESYFKSVFKKCSGCSYSEYLTNTRMNQAKTLLNTTEKSVTEIAFDVGFHTSNSFSSLFKRETGCTPTQFKKQTQKKPTA